MNDGVDKLKEIIRKSESLVAFTGAGLSCRPNTGNSQRKRRYISDYQY